MLNYKTNQMLCHPIRNSDPTHANAYWTAGLHLSTITSISGFFPHLRNMFENGSQLLYLIVSRTIKKIKK
ncbi:hypothetical protein Avbf_11368 [Armadillidium vulgare]|nr:hypothetical protein Avbf_11368 [Armadillidium vulgare]